MNARPLVVSASSAMSPLPVEAKAEALPPGSSHSPERQTFEYFSRPYEFLREGMRAYGDAFTVRFRDFGTHVIVADPEGIRRTFEAGPHQALGGTGNAILRPILGPTSLLALDGTHHARVRRILLPPFYAKRSRDHAIAMRNTAREVTAKWQGDELVAISDATFDISLAVIVRVVLGDRAYAGDVAARVAALMRLANTGTAFVERAGAARARFDAAVGALDDSLAQLIDEARVHPDASAGVLGLLVATRDQDGQPLSVGELRDQLVTLLVAGHETTATAIAWTMHLVHANADVLARLRGDLARLGPSPAVEDWTSLPYLEAVCHETLRLRPVVPVVSRFLTAPLDLGAGRHVPEGVFVTPSPYLAHHRAEVFAEPDEFRPARFLDRKFAASEYLPFGGGGRRCLASTFALQEMKIALAALLTDFDFQPALDEAVRPVRRSVTVGPSNFRMRVRRRSDQIMERN